MSWQFFWQPPLSLVIIFVSLPWACGPPMVMKAHCQGLLIPNGLPRDFRRSVKARYVNYPHPVCIKPVFRPRLHSPVCCCGVAKTLSVPSRSSHRCYGLCDEQVFGWRLGGTLCRFVIQQSLSVLAVSGMAVASRAGVDLAMDHSGHCNPSWHRNYPPGNGNIFRYQSYHPSFT